MGAAAPHIRPMLPPPRECRRWGRRREVPVAWHSVTARRCDLMAAPCWHRGCMHGAGAAWHQRSGRGASRASVCRRGAGESAAVPSLPHGTAGLEGTLRGHLATPCRRQGQLPRPQGACNPVQPGLGHWQGTIPDTAPSRLTSAPSL